MKLSVYILLNNDHSKVLINAFMVLTFFDFSIASVKAQSIEPQQLKVKFIIEDGNRDGAKITIEKDGKIWKNKEGSAQQTFQMEYGHEFLFTFSKPGYITKKIVFSTVVPKALLKDGFEPYLLDLSLFKQYDGVNIVAFAQPVAKIIYKADIDDFGYDTNYNKFVLSEQKAEEDKIKQIQETARVTGVPAKVIGAPNADNTNANSSEGDRGKDDLTNQKQSETDRSRNEPVDKNSSEAEVKNDKNIQGVTENEGKGKLTAQTDTDAKQGLNSVTEAEQRANQKLPAMTEEERRRKLALAAENENRNNAGTGNGKVSRDEENIEEGNRKITKVTLIVNGHITVYKKIVYKWGGVYFFQDDRSITESAFLSEAM